MITLVTIFKVVQVLSALVIIGLVLLQHGKGADMGAAFGSGASGSLFGATGSSNFLSKATGFAAAVFFCATLALAYFGSKHTGGTGGVLENMPAAAAPAVPAASSSTESSAPAAANAPASSTSQTNQIPK
jgi:preprotein translocase subunit SecG